MKFLYSVATNEMLIHLLVLGPVSTELLVLQPSTLSLNQSELLAQCL